MHVELICVVKQFSREDSYVLLLCGDIGVGESFVGGSYSCWRFSSRVYGTSCRVFSSCSLNDSLPEGLNQPIQSSLHTHTRFSLSSSCLSNSIYSTSTTVLFQLLQLNLCYLLLSGYQDMEKSGSLTARMKGGGGIGITGGGRGQGDSHAAPSRPFPHGIHPGGKTLKLVCVYPVSYVWCYRLLICFSLDLYLCVSCVFSFMLLQT